MAPCSCAACLPARFHLQPRGFPAVLLHLSECGTHPVNTAPKKLPQVRLQSDLLESLQAQCRGEQVGAACHARLPRHLARCCACGADAQMPLCAPCNSYISLLACCAPLPSWS